MNQKIEFTTSVEINASSKKVWDIFMDTSKYPEWNPFIHRVFGEIKPNCSILEIAYFYDHLYLPIFMKIIEFESEKKITWVGNFPGFKDYHSFKFQELGNGKMTFLHEANFSGLFANFSKNHITTNVKRVHGEMNIALKQRAETR